METALPPGAKSRYSDLRRAAALVLTRLENYDPAIIFDMVAHVKCEKVPYEFAVKRILDTARKYSALPCGVSLPGEELYIDSMLAVERAGNRLAREYNSTDVYAMNLIVSGVSTVLHQSKAFPKAVSPSDYERIMAPWRRAISIQNALDKSAPPAPKKQLVGKDTSVNSLLNIDDTKGALQRTLASRNAIIGLRLPELTRMARAVSEPGISAYTKSLLNAMELVRILPEKPSRFFVAGFTIAKATSTELIESHKSDLHYVVGDDGLEAVHQTLVGACVAILSQEYAGIWKDYAVSDYYALMGPWWQAKSSAGRTIKSSVE